MQRLRWFMFPVEAAAVLQLHAGGGLPLTHLPPLAKNTTGAMQPRVYSPVEEAEVLQPYPIDFVRTLLKPSLLDRNFPY